MPKVSRTFERPTVTSIEALLPGTDWTNEEHVKSFTEELEEFAQRIRQEEMEKLVSRLLVFRHLSVCT